MIKEAKTGIKRTNLFRDKRKEPGKRREGVSEGVNLLLEFIKNNPGKRVPHFEKALNVPAKTIERWLNRLKKKNKIEFRGSSKTGGIGKLENENIYCWR